MAVFAPGCFARCLAALAICCLASLSPLAAQTAAYTIHVGDQIQVLVFGAPSLNALAQQGSQTAPAIQSLSTTVTVLSDGSVTYPLIGSVQVEGLEPQAAAERISQALQTYVLHPRVSVIVVKGTMTSVEVLGSVDHGGRIEIRPGDRLVNALALAGVGPSVYSDLNHITLNRVVDGVPHVYNVNLYNMLLNADYSANPVLQAGDVVYVPKAKQRDLSSIPFVLYYLYLLATPGVPH